MLWHGKTCYTLAWRMLLVGLVFTTPTDDFSVQAAEPLVAEKAEHALRIATYNVSLNRNEMGQLKTDLQADDLQARAVAAVIRTVRPDVLLLNELDYSESADNARLFESKYLANEQPDDLGNVAWPMPFTFCAAVNTGVPSGMDLNGNRRTDDPEDAWGYGRFPGQYGMAVLSRYAIRRDAVRTLQKLAWSALPDAKRPVHPESGEPYYDDATWQRLRLSSKSFWDVAVATPLGALHVLASHPTPPAFDGPEDRNGCRNHDEIRLIRHFIESAPFIVDDAGQAGGLGPDDAFVVLGDLNSDPQDGDSQRSAIVDLLNHFRVAKYPIPTSAGGAAAASSQGGANLKQRGNPAHDTGDFSDRTVGNLRIDYVLPSHNFRVLAAGVFWPSLSQVAPELRDAARRSLAATDHHLVWADIWDPAVAPTQPQSQN